MTPEGLLPHSFMSWKSRQFFLLIFLKITSSNIPVKHWFNSRTFVYILFPSNLVFSSINMESTLKYTSWIPICLLEIAFSWGSSLFSLGNRFLVSLLSGTLSFGVSRGGRWSLWCLPAATVASCGEERLNACTDGTRQPCHNGYLHCLYTPIPVYVIYVWPKYIVISFISI